MSSFVCLVYTCQPGFGYQQQLVPGMRPGGAPMPNFVVPMVQQEQPGQRPGGRRAGAVAGQQAQQPVPLVEQQVGGTSNLSFPSSLCMYSHSFFIWWLVWITDASKGSCISLPTRSWHAICFHGWEDAFCST